MKLLSGKARQRVFLALDDGWSAAQLEAGVCGSLVACQGQDLYRRERKLKPPETIVWLTAQDTAAAAGEILAEGINLTRRLVNEPPNRIYPESFVAEMEQLASHAGLELEIWDEDRLQAEGCGALLAVATGSVRPPRLAVLRYRGGQADGVDLALVGKGVTFDSGGLSLKPSDGMKTMKCDMAGAATVVGALACIARLKLPVNVNGLMGLVENMPGSKAFKLGDVLTARSGRTIEVLNTDAEGRLVLADVLSVAVEQKPGHIIDLATLTGACVVAL